MLKLMLAPMSVRRTLALTVYVLGMDYDQAEEYILTEVHLQDRHYAGQFTAEMRAVEPWEILAETAVKRPIPKRSAAEKREDAIRAVVDRYIGRDDRLGEIIDPTATFGTLVFEVAELKKLGRTDRWIAGIDSWINTIVDAVSQFSDSMVWDGTWDLWDAKRDDFTRNGQADFDRLLMWAVLQGSVYATHGNL